MRICGVRKNKHGHNFQNIACKMPPTVWGRDSPGSYCTDLVMTELLTTSSPSVKRQPAGLGKIESYKWKDMRPAGLVQIQAVDTIVLPPPRLRRLTASSSPINIALNWGWRHHLPELVNWTNNLANYPCHTHQDQTIHSPFLSFLGRMQEIKRSQCIENIQLWSILIRIPSCLCCTITCITYPAKTHPLYIKIFLGVLLVIDQD